MTRPGELGVSAAAMSSLASSVSAVEAAVEQARQAALSVSVPTDAFGILCQFFPPMLDPVEQGGVDVLTDGVGALDATVTALQNAAVAYREQEAVNLDAVRAAAPGSGG